MKTRVAWLVDCTEVAIANHEFVRKGRRVIWEYPSKRGLMELVKHMYPNDYKKLKPRKILQLLSLDRGEFPPEKFREGIVYLD